MSAATHSAQVPTVTYPVGNRPTPIEPHGFPVRVTLINTGPKVLYLDHARTVSAAALPLNPGATIVWDKGKPLYAVSPTADGILTITENAGPLSDPTVLAAALVAQGLPAQIAQAIDLQGINAGGVTASIPGTVTAAIPAGTTPLTPATGPTLVHRNLSAQSSGSSSQSANGTSTVIPAPGAGKSLELHNLALTLHGVSSGTTGSLSAIIEDTTGADFFSLGLSIVAGASGQTGVVFDLAGVTLPANRGVRCVFSGIVPGTISGGVDAALTYVVVQ